MWKRANWLPTPRLPEWRTTHTPSLSSTHTSTKWLPEPSDPICTIKFTIHRLSGEVETWRRMNLGFLKAIRKQMLIWRLVDAEHKTQYDIDGKKLLGKALVTE